MGDSRLTFIQYLTRISAAYFDRAYQAAGKSVYALLAVCGGALETARAQLAAAVAQFGVATAGGAWLDRRGACRNLVRVAGESDDDYAVWLAGAFDRYLLMGNKAVMAEMLARFGFTATIAARWEGYGPRGPVYSRADWYVFDVTLDATSGAYPDNVFYSLVRRTKEAHSYCEFHWGAIDWATYDDWDILVGDAYGAGPKYFDDGGTFDDF